MKRITPPMRFAIMFVCMTISAVAQTPPASPILSSKSIYQVDGDWSDDGGKPFKIESLRGKPVVLVMFFTRCELACPLMLGELQTLRAALPAGVRDATRFVLVSMDVARDDANSLRAYRQRNKLDGENWILLRGTHESVTDLAMLLGLKFKQDTRGQFAHSNLITVLNKEGEIVRQRSGVQEEKAPVIKAVIDAAR